MQIKTCTPADFNWIHKNLTLFWGDTRTQFIHHPMFIYEFGNTAFVIEKDNEIVGYLFGFFSQLGDYGYIHAIGIHDDYKRQGIGTILYDHFTMICKKHGKKKIKAITTPSNVNSIRFHQSVGFAMVGSDAKNGVTVVSSYAGEHEDRVVMIKTISE